MSFGLSAKAKDVQFMPTRSSFPIHNHFVGLRIGLGFDGI